MPDARWSILTSTSAPGAVAIVQVEGDIDGALAAMGLAPMRPGEVRLRSLAGVDEGLAVRWDERTLHLTPHGGPEVQRALGRELTSRGIAPAAPDHAPRFPEAASAIEERMLRTLARAASPLAIDLLLDQPRRWSAAGPSPADLAPAPILNRLIEPPLVVLLGAPNIGKSTLVNALAGRTVSIVADEPGTTRDHVGVTIDLAGVVARVVDTPGLRAEPGPVEHQAASLAVELARTAALVVLCGDRDHSPPSFEPGAAQVRLALRVDRGFPEWEYDAAVSAPRGDGLADLVGLLRERLVPRAALADLRPWKFWADRSG